MYNLINYSNLLFFILECNNIDCTGYPYDPVCGTDGETHANACELEIAACYNPQMNITVACKGRCPCRPGNMFMHTTTKSIDIYNGLFLKNKNALHNVI